MTGIKKPLNLRGVTRKWVASSSSVRVIALTAGFSTFISGLPLVYLVSVYLDSSQLSGNR